MVARPSERPVAIIDIGSNSVRLVVYSGATRVPSPTFNEKVLAGLGRLTESNALTPAAQKKALEALARFKLLLKHMKVGPTRVVATAAARDAENGREFVSAVRKLGLDCEVLTAEEEARLAGEGVLSAIPGASGMVGDLGGGSLELVDVDAGRVGSGISMPLGVLRVPTGAEAERQVRKTVRQALERAGLSRAGKDRPFYMVGGTWRALARMDMIASDFPLKITHQYRMEPNRAAALREVAANPDKSIAKLIASARLSSTPVAAMLLSVLVDEIEPNELIVSTFGIREGLLFSALTPRVRGYDPLIEGARDAGGGECRFGEHGDLLDDWIAPAFDDPPQMARLRHAACVLADVAWQANAEFRADRAVEMALHGNWVGVGAEGRVIMAQALSSSFGRDKLPDERLLRLVTPQQRGRAQQWGLAIRLAQRLSGGVGSVLEASELRRSDGCLELRVPRKESALIGEPVLRRLASLAESMGLKAGLAARSS